MSEQTPPTAVAPPANPFSTRFVRPDQSRYQFSAADDLLQLSGRVSDELLQRGIAAIIGPHGTGKSTLLHSLMPILAERFAAVPLLRLSSTGDAAEQLRQWQRGLQARAADAPARGDDAPADGSDQGPATFPACWVIDGFEQLRPLTRQRLIWQARRRRRKSAGKSLAPPCLLVTAHRPQFAVATVYQTGWDAALVRRLTEQKLAALPGPWREAMLEIAERELTAISRRPESDRNVRDYWFLLYDRYERLRANRPLDAGSLRSPP